MDRCWVEIECDDEELHTVPEAERDDEELHTALARILGGDAPDFGKMAPSVDKQFRSVWRLRNDAEPSPDFCLDLCRAHTADDFVWYHLTLAAPAGRVGAAEVQIGMVVAEMAAVQWNRARPGDRVRLAASVSCTIKSD